MNILTPQMKILAASVHKLNYEFNEKGNYYVICQPALPENDGPLLNKLEAAKEHLIEKARSDPKSKNFQSISTFYKTDKKNEEEGERLTVSVNYKNYDYLEGRNPIAFFNTARQPILEPVPIHTHSIVYLNIRIWFTKVGAVLHIVGQPHAIQIVKLADPNEKGSFDDYFAGVEDECHSSAQHQTPFDQPNVSRSQIQDCQVQSLSGPPDVFDDSFGCTG